MNNQIDRILINFKSSMALDINKLIDKIEDNANMIASIEYLKEDLNNILYTIESTSTKY